MVTLSQSLVDYFGKVRILAPMTDGELAAIIGENVRAARAARGITQAELGESSGIAVPHISRLESGKHLTSVTTLLRIANALEVPICALLDKLPRKRKQTE